MPLVEVRGSEIVYNLHSGQWRAWNSEARFILMLAATQSGKTAFTPLWLHREIQRRGMGDYFCATANYDLFKLKLLPEMLRYFCELLRWGRYLATDRVIVNKEGDTRIILRSAESPGGLESATAKAAVLDEFGLPTVTVDAWEAIQRRLSIYQGRALIVTTPYTVGWLKQQIYDRWKAGDKEYDVIQFPSIANPTFPEEEYYRMMQILPDWKFQQFYNGQFVRPAGLIYGDYIDSYASQDKYGRVVIKDWTEGVHGHLCKPFKIPESWPRLVGVDPGGVEHTALVWLAEDPETECYYAYRESLGGGMAGSERAREALQYNEPVRLWMGGARSEQASRDTWGLAGVPLAAPVIFDLEAGIDRVIGLFRQRRLFVFDTMTGLRSELGTYSRELDAVGEPTEKIADKELFHRLDALRSICSVLSLDTMPLQPVAQARSVRAAIVDDYDRKVFEKLAAAERTGAHALDDAVAWGGESG